MTSRPLLRLFCGLMILLIVGGPVKAEPSVPVLNLFELLAARGIRSNYQATDLTPAWRVVQVESAQERSALEQRRERADDWPWAGFYYTRGDLVSFAGETYFIVYRVVPPSEQQELRRQQQFGYAWRTAETGAVRSDFPPLEENTTLSLSLVPLSHGASLHEIRAFDPERDVLTEEGKGKRRVEIERVMSQFNLRQISLGLLQYVQDYDMMLPPMRAAQSREEYEGVGMRRVTPTTPVQVMLSPYLHNVDLFTHPGTGRPYLPNFRISRRSIFEFNDANTSVFFEDAPDAEGKRNVAFLDGSVRALDEEDWQKLRKAAGISESGLPSALPPGSRNVSPAPGRPPIRPPSAPPGAPPIPQGLILEKL